MGRLLSKTDLRVALEGAIKPEYITVWLETPNEAFGGLTPLEAFRLDPAEMLYRLGSGEPS